MAGVIARAHTNIALVKYWGKREGVDRTLNLPATGSLSMTLDRFFTETEVVLGGERDVFLLDGVPVDGDALARVSRFLDLVRTPLERKEKARVTSRNHVPTAAGLASSASGFAALALAATRAYDVENILQRTLSRLARQGSGSAARSIHGGFVLLQRGAHDDGSDCFAQPITTALDARLVVVRCARGEKDVSSTRGMEHSARTSPFYPAWIDTHALDLEEAQAALATNDIAKLGEVMEHSTFKMHATTFSARPPFWYWKPVSLAVLDAVRALRQAGVGAWATMDAGPHVKILCTHNDASAVAAHMEAIEGVVDCCVAGVGGPARLISGFST